MLWLGFCHFFFWAVRRARVSIHARPCRSVLVGAVPGASSSCPRPGALFGPGGWPFKHLCCPRNDICPSASPDTRILGTPKEGPFVPATIQERAQKLSKGFPRIQGRCQPLAGCFQLWPPQVGFKSIHRTVATCCAHLEGGHCFLPGGFSKFVFSQLAFTALQYAAQLLHQTVQ